MRRLILLTLLACGGGQPSADAGVDNPKFRNPLEPINALCKKWELGQYVNVATGKIEYFNYCVRW